MTLTVPLLDALLYVAPCVRSGDRLKVALKRLAWLQRTRPLRLPGRRYAVRQKIRRAT